MDRIISKTEKNKRRRKTIIRLTAIVGGLIATFVMISLLTEDSISIKSVDNTISELQMQLRQLHTDYNIECQRRDIRLTMELSSEQCLACIDAIQFEQILVNIIKNAYEAIEQDGEIRIITATNPLSIAIWNNGPAISDEVAKNLFIPFFSTKPSGQGVGLMIVREILRNHNTNFKFYSENGWTKFEIDFSL